MDAAPSLSALSSLELVLTASCNLSCGYCYQNAKQQKRMDEATMERALDLILRSGKPRVSVLFIGGEPLLELPLIRHGVAYVEARRRPDQEVEYQLLTNGLLLDAAAARFLAAHDFVTQLSHDGVAAAQAVRGRGTHGRLDAIIERLRRDEPSFFERRLRVQITVTGATVPHLADSFAYHLGKGFSLIRIRACDTFDPTWSNDLMPELDRQFGRILDLSLRHFRTTGRIPFDLFRRQKAARRRQPQGRTMCGVGRGTTLAVDVDGSVSGCVTFAESYQKFPSRLLRERLASLRLGALGDEAMPRRLALYPQAVEAAGMFDRKEDKHSSFGRCGECRYLADCAICPVSIGQAPGNDDPRRIPDFPCAFSLVSLKHRERFPLQAAHSQRFLRAKKPGTAARALAGWLQEEAVT